MGNIAGPRPVVIDLSENPRDRYVVPCACGHDYNDPNEATFKGAPYGVNPSYYSPRCIPCHAIFDSEMNIAIGKTDQRPKKTATR